jgi:hypothetical protein
VAGELNLKHAASGKTILALILGQNRATRWNGTAMAAISSVSDANWTAGMVTLTEQLTSNNTPTTTYVGNFPAGIAAPGEYAVQYYLNTAAAPGSPAIGTQEVWWNGSAAIYPATPGDAMTLQSGERDSVAAALLDLANTIDGKTVRQALRIIAAVLAGKVSGAGSGTETFRSLNDQIDRVVVAADAGGNRTNVTYQ